MRASSGLLLFALACTGADPDDSKDFTDPDTEIDTEVPDDTEVAVETDPPLDEPAELIASGVASCAAPEAREGAPYALRIVEFDPPPRVYLSGAGAALGDLTGDARPDIVIVSHAEVLLYTQDETGEFEGSTLIEVEVPNEFVGLFGASVFDVEDDGDLDLLITGRGTRNFLLINDGTGSFTDGTTAAGLMSAAAHHSTSSSWSDFDGDGIVDLFIGGHGWVDEAAEIADFLPADPSLLYRGNGDGTFTDVSSLLPQNTHDGYTFVGGWTDVDADGDDDLYVANDFGAKLEPCSVIYNDGGTFHTDGGASGMNALMAGMGLALGDYDGDGLEEIAVPAWNINAFLQRRGSIWLDAAQSVAYAPDEDRTVGWGSEFVDVDNDGQLDLTTAYGWLDTAFGGYNWREQPDAMYVQRDGVLAERSAIGGFDDNAPNRSIVPADLNRDGWMDFVKPGLDGKGRLYLSRCGTEGWLHVTLSQPAPNINAIGATVRIYDDDQLWMRRVRAGGTGYGSGGPPEVLIGLGDRERIDRLEVEWPDGRIDTFDDVMTRQRLEVRRP